VGKGGYFKVAYGASGIADLSNTWGLRFKPLKPVPAYSASQVSPAAKQGCYHYRAAGDDYFGRVADKFGVSVKQLVLDNLDTVKDPAAPLGGRTLMVCNAANVGDALPPSSQGDALLKIKTALDPNNLLTWLGGHDDKAATYCYWKGITCDASGSVTRVALTQLTVGSTKLGGVLPDAYVLAFLPKLKAFEVVGQNLAGTLPDDYAKLKMLEVLSLHGNNLRGTLPASWAAMAALQSLTLGGYTSSNLLEGTLPPTWGLLANLRQLSLVGNRFRGTLPASWGALRLGSLSLGHNRLTGSLPSSWAPMVFNGLEQLYLQDNLLSGPLPEAW
jgi:hypothetical protein